MKIKRYISIIITLALCAGLLSALCPHASADTLEEQQQALIAVAMAYYDKGHSVQYDGKTIVDKVPRADGGKTRSTNREPPEYATPHETFYSVCSDFIDQVYWETFRYSIFKSAGSCWTGGFLNIPQSSPAVIYYYEKSSGKDPKEAMHELCRLMQPGDVFTTYSTAGHSMLYIGDVFGDGGDYMIHSFGGSINTDTGRDNREYLSKTGPDVDPRYGATGWTDGSGGGIRLTPNAESHLTSAYAKGTQERFGLVRPLNLISADNYPITPATRFRMQHPRLSIDRIVEEKTRFNSTLPGETLTLSVTLKNSSAAGYAFPVTEPIPAGVEFLEASEGGTFQNGIVSWDVQLEAGQSQTLWYTCRVTASRGAQIVFDGGKVGSDECCILSNRIPITVGGKKLTAEDRAKLTEIANGGYADLLASATAATVGDTVYEKILGRRVSIPDAGRILSRMTENRVFSNGCSCLVFTDESKIAAEDLQDFRMLVPMLHSGMRIWNEWGHERCVDPRDMHVEAGDLIVRTPDALATEPVQDVMVYLGDGKYLEYLDGAPAIVEEPEFVKCILQGGYYVLRPTLAYDELPAQPTLTVRGAALLPGQSGTATLKLANNPGIRNVQLTLTYGDALTLTEVDTGSALAGLQFVEPPSLASPATFLWCGNTAKTSEGTLLTLHFTAAPDAAEGEYPIQVTVTPDSMLGVSGVLSPQTVDGVIRITNRLPGDLNGDGKVNAKDVTVLRRYLAGGYGVTLEETIADFNGDGSVNAKDVTALRRYLADGGALQG